jgi:hypothetical protein
VDAQTKRLLTEALRREEALAGAGVPRVEGGDFEERCRQAGRVIDHERQVDVGPSWCSTDWLGAVTPGEKMKASRLLHRLEDAGLVAVFRLDGRALNVRITGAGRAALAAEGQP